MLGPAWLVIKPLLFNWRTWAVVGALVAVAAWSAAVYKRGQQSERKKITQQVVEPVRETVEKQDRALRTDLQQYDARDALLAQVLQNQNQVLAVAEAAVRTANARVVQARESVREVPDSRLNGEVRRETGGSPDDLSPLQPPELREVLAQVRERDALVEKVDQLEKAKAETDAKIATLEQRFTNMEQKAKRAEQGYDALMGNFTVLHNTFAEPYRCIQRLYVFGKCKRKMPVPDPISLQKQLKGDT